MMLIPRTALTQGMKAPKVFVVENGIARLKDIVIGMEMGNSVEVVSGIEEGAQVITSGQLNIKDGSKINLVNIQN